MRAVQAIAFGGPEVLEPATAPDPEAGTGQVVVEVEVAGVLSLDAIVRRGGAPGPYAERTPYVPGRGVAGRVAEIGPDVDPGWLGRRVLAQVDRGGYAERVAAPVAELYPIPDEVGAGPAMALLHDGNTALGLFEVAGVDRGERVLVQPAAGGAGSLLVQLAHAAGARVIAAAGGTAKLELAAALGADAVVDYDEPDWTGRVRAAFGGVDVVFDGVGGERGLAAYENLGAGGRYSGYGLAGGGPAPIDRDAARLRGVHVAGMERLQGLAADRHARVERLLRAVGEGRITPVIGQTFPLARAAEAHAALESRAAVGKTLLTM